MTSDVMDQEIATPPGQQMTLAQAILLIPPGVYLKCGCEQNAEEDGPFGSAALFEEPPEDGWPSPRHPADTFLDRVIASITTDETDFEAFENLTVLMIVQRYGSDRQKAEARAKLDRQTDRREQAADETTRASATAKAAW